MRNTRLCVILGLALSVSAATAAAAKRPTNLVFILADDLGYGDLGCYGQKLIQTPRLDQMAADAMYSRNIATNPRRASEEDIAGLYRRAMG